MALDFMVKDVTHKVTAKYVHAFLPDAKKPYNLRAVFQPEVNIHEIASKAEIIAVNEPRTLKVIVPATPGVGVIRPESRYPKFGEERRGSAENRSGDTVRLQVDRSKLDRGA